MRVNEKQLVRSWGEGEEKTRKEKKRETWRNEQRTKRVKFTSRTPVTYPACLYDPEEGRIVHAISFSFNDGPGGRARRRGADDSGKWALCGTLANGERAKKK